MLMFFRKNINHSVNQEVNLQVLTKSFSISNCDVNKTKKSS